MKERLFFYSCLLSLLFVGVIQARSSKNHSSGYWHVEETSISQFLRTPELDESPCNLSMIDCIYLINLDRRPDRLERMQGLLQHYGLHAKRLPAVDGKSLTEGQKQTLFGPYPVRMSNGAIGCLLSHLSVLQDAYQRGFKRIWVLEDDVLISEDPHVLPLCLTALEKLDPYWDIFFTDIDAKGEDGEYIIACVSDFRPNQPQKKLSYYQKKKRVGTDFFRVRQRFGTWSMIISREGMRKILEYYNHVFLWSPYDIDLFYTPGLNCYTPRRDIVTQWLEGQYSDTCH